MRLHKKHGLCPVMSKCILCGGETGDIALLGASWKGDSEPPKSMITSFEPCNKCKEEKLNGYVLLLEVEGGQENPKPTGNNVRIRDKVFSQMFNAPIPPKKVGLIPPELFNRLVAVETERQEREDAIAKNEV